LGFTVVIVYTFCRYTLFIFWILNIMGLTVVKGF